MKKILATITALVLLCLLALPVAATADITPHSAAFAAEVLRLTNAERARYGLPALAGTNGPLNSAAQRRAVETATLFSHTRPNGTPWHTVFNEFAVGNRVSSGENLGRGQTTPAQVVQGWMNSPGHRANVLGAFSHLGVGVHRNSAGTYHWAQLFLNDGSVPTNTSSGFNFWNAALSVWNTVLSVLGFMARILSFGLLIMPF